MEREAILRLKLTAQNEANPAFESAAQAMRDLNGPAETASKAFNEAASGLRGFTDSLKSASTTINDTGKSFEAVTQASGGLTKALEGDQKAVGEVTQSLSGFDRALNETAQTMRGVGEASQAFNKASGNANTLKESVDKGGLLIGMQMLGQSMEGVGETGAHMFEDAIKSAAEFEANISRIHAVLMNREPNANMEEMSQTALRLGSNSKFSANEIAQGLYDLARQGLSSTQILGDGVNGAIEVVNNLAQSTDTDMSETAKVITDVMHEFSMSGDQLAKVGDMISGTMHTSSISMNDFYYSLRQVGPVASNMHQSIEDVSTVIAELAQHGISGSSAGTALKNMLLGLEPRTEKAAALMKDLGISAKNGAADSFYQLNGNLKPLPDIIGVLHDKFGDLNDSQKQAALSATFTKYGLAGLNTIVGEGKDKFQELKKTLMEEKSADIAREKMNNLQGDMWKLNASVETAKKSFGDTLAPAMRSVAQAAQGAVNWFAELSPATKQAIMVVGGIASAMFVVGGSILSVVSTLGFLKMGMQGLMGTSATLTGLLSPIGLVIAAVAVLGLAVYELIKHWDEVNAWMRQHIGIDLPQIWTALKSTATAVFKAISDIFSDAWNGIKKITQEVWDYIGPTITDGLKAISDFWGEVFPQMRDIAKAFWDFLEPIVRITWELIKGYFSVSLGFIKGAWSDTWNAIKDLFKTAWDLLVDLIRIGWDDITGIFKIALDLLSGNWSKAWEDMKTLLSNLFGDINKLFGDFVTNSFNFGKDMVMAVARGIEGAIDAAISAARKVVSAITSIFSSAPTSPSISSGNAISQAAAAVPQFAEGGKVTKPTLAMVGEGGEPEYILPESKLRGQDGYTLGLNGVSMPGGASGVRTGQTVINGGINITVSGAGKDGKQIGSDIMSMLRREFKFAL
ncbi:phage tail tape measure protein [Paenibacillus aestuarii]|uniref:Phage tail tape measure protein n=1 Tax=Paenibacillus aestuarii TaxID=516965 RepID=A0ABW0K2I7_9BACL|nr:phage tail tape measure protein [Paenibacillus aestuarii]